MPKNKHLTNEERFDIEHMLKEGNSIKKIAKTVGKHHSTIAREIKNRAVESNKGAVGRISNRCVKRISCSKIQLCLNKPDCTRRCSTCKHCNEVCPDFVEDVCVKLFSPPYVCNGCPEGHQCVLRKRFYLHKAAHKDYQTVLVESRAGANITEEELLEIDQLVSPLILQGQSVHHIMVNNPDLFNVHEKTIYRYITGKMFSAKNGDMPRICMLKPRKSKPVEHKVDSKCRIGRTHNDYLVFVDANPDIRVAEMDTVIGRIGGKAILTIMLPWCGFMLARLRNRNDARSVKEQFQWLWEVLGPELFAIILPLLLTDNGSEFSDPAAIEMAPDGTRRSHLFYCDPRATNQKARIERNHELLRTILPKGTSFDGLTQDALDTIMSHVNSYSRPSLADKAPADLFAYAYGESALTALGIRRIPSNQIILKPKLIEQIM